MPGAVSLVLGLSDRDRRRSRRTRSTPASQYLLRSLDDGASWEKVSPDLSGAVEGTKGCDGEVTLANAQPCGFGVIFTIELSPRDAQEIWVGTDDGLIQRTKDGGKTWKNVTPKGLPAWSKISTLDVSPLEPDVVYAAVDAHRRDDFTPHVYRTRDGGESWQEISSGLPSPGFAMVVRADTVRRGLLYAGTDTGVFVSFDDGDHWQTLQSEPADLLGRRPAGPRRRPRHRHAGPGTLGRSTT